MPHVSFFAWRASLAFIAKKERGESGDTPASGHGQHRLVDAEGERCSYLTIGS